MQVSYGRDSLAPVFLQLPLRDYLAAILPGLGDLPVSRVAELTPTAWAARS